MSGKKNKKKTKPQKQSHFRNNSGSLILAIKKAETCFHTNNESEILEILRDYAGEVKSADNDTQNRFSRLLAYGLAFKNQLTEAEKICLENIKIHPVSVDYYYILIFISLSLREYENVKKYADLYFQHLNSISTADHLTGSSNHQCQAHNFIGSAYMEEAKIDKAKEHYRKAIELDSGNHLPYINLVNACMTSNDYQTAEQIIETGLKACRQIQELRLLEKSLKNRQTISACMIVKNEEELLSGCLESIRDWVDEIILVDTGSTDNTVEIAKSFGAKIYHQAWEGDFSKHRNYSLEQAKSDWIFIIDADERIFPEDVPLIKRFVNSPENSILSINVYNVYGTHKDITTFLPSVRFWRRDVNLRYEGIVHNLLKLGEEHAVTRTNIRLQHLGYDLSREKMTEKFHRTKSLLEKQLEENPDNTFALFNYAQILKSEGEDYPKKNIPDIIKTASRAVELTNPKIKEEKHIHLMCLDQIAWAHFYNNEYRKAMDFAQKALNIKADYLDPLILEAHIYAHEKKWSEAEQAYLKYIEAVDRYKVADETDPLIITNIENRAAAWYSLALICETSKRFEEAKRYYHLILENQIGYLEANNRLAMLYLAENNLDEAKKYFNRQIQNSNKTGDTLIGLAEAYDRENDPQKSEEYYKEAISYDYFNSEYKLKYAEFLIKKNRTEEGFNIISEVSDKNPKTHATNLKIANLLYELERYEEASKIYERLLSYENPEVYNNLGNCYFKMKQLAEAEQYYLKAVDKGNVESVVYRNLGITQTGLNKFDDAIDNLRRYLDSHEDLAVLMVLSEIYFKKEDYQEAMKHYERYLSKNPFDYVALFYLSECYLHMGHEDSAKIGYRRVVGFEPGFHPAHERLAELNEIISR